MLCLERLALYFLVCFSFFSVHNKLDPSMPCLGEIHAPLLPRMLTVFTFIFLSVQSLLPVGVMFSSCFSCLFLSKS